MDTCLVIDGYIKLSIRSKGATAVRVERHRFDAHGSLKSLSQRLGDASVQFQ